MICALMKVSEGVYAHLVKKVATICSERLNWTFSNFINIQQSHTIACEGYHQPYVRTGYESVIGRRTTQEFCYAATDDGVVLSIDDKGIIIEYKDKTQKGIEIGRRFGQAEGSTYPHDIVANVSVGEKFKRGKIIAYHSGFFEKDVLNPKDVIYKSSMIGRMTLYESTLTFEDSSGISSRMANMMKTRVTKVKSFVVEFTQGVRNIVKKDTVVGPNDVLFIIEDAITANSELFDDETIEALKRLANKSPKAKVSGVVDKIEVFYHGDKEDMSESLRAIANASDRAISSLSKSIGKRVTDGRVGTDYRVNGKALMVDTAEIKIYLTVEDVAGVGDY